MYQEILRDIESIRSDGTADVACIYMTQESMEQIITEGGVFVNDRGTERVMPSLKLDDIEVLLVNELLKGYGFMTCPVYRLLGQSKEEYVYLLFEQTSDQYGTERLVDAYATKSLAERGQKFNRGRTRIQEKRLIKNAE